MAVQAKAKKRVSPTPGSYITNGIRLFRVETLLSNRGGVVIEDCHSLKLISLSFDEFRKGRFRAVDA